MVVYIVPIPAKHAVLNTVISAYGHTVLAANTKKLAEKFDVVMYMQYRIF